MQLPPLLLLLRVSLDRGGSAMRWLAGAGCVHYLNIIVAVSEWVDVEQLESRLHFCVEH